MLANANSVVGSWAGAIAALGILLVALLILTRWKERQERLAVAFAKAECVDFFGDELPADLPTELIEQLPPSLPIRRCFSGLRRGERVVSFEYAAGFGRQRSWITLAAVRQQHPERPIQRTGGVEVRCIRNWAFVQQPGGAFWRSGGAPGVVELWDLLHTTTSEEVSALQQAQWTHTNLHIVPRHEARRGNHR